LKVCRVLYDGACPTCRTSSGCAAALAVSDVNCIALPLPALLCRFLHGIALRFMWHQPCFVLLLLLLLLLLQTSASSRASALS
jgi:energy-coupling factor transporter transmembrane protein EcfT